MQRTSFVFLGVSFAIAALGGGTGCQQGEAGALASTTETTGATDISGAPPLGAPGASPLPAVNAPPTEGTLEVRIEGMAPRTLGYALRGDKIRLALSSAPNNPKQGIATVLDITRQTATMIMNDQKRFAEVDLSKLAHVAGALTARRTPNIQLVDTGKKDTVAGAPCDELLLSSEHFEVTTCARKSRLRLDVDALERAIGFTAPSWLRQILDESYLPLRVGVRQKNGRPIVTTNVNEISHAPVPDSSFEVPTGYERTTVFGLPEPPSGGRH